MSNILNYEHLKTKQDAKTAAEDLDRRNRAVFQQLLEKHGLLASHEANFQMLVKFAGGELTPEKAEFLLNNPPPGISLQFQDERNAWIKKILDLLHDPTQKRFTSWDEAQERKRLAYKTRSELMARYEQLKLKQEMARKSAPELRADIAAIRKAEERDNPFPGWPRLPKQIVRPGTVRAVQLDAAYIKNLDAFSLKRLVAVYGPWVNARLNGTA